MDEHPIGKSDDPAREVKSHFESVAKDYDYWKAKSSLYYDAIRKVILNFVPEGGRVLELGCGTGDMLNAVKPKLGIGVDISVNMVRISRSKYPHLGFYVSNAENPGVKMDFDRIIMPDLIDHLIDVRGMFKNLRPTLKDDCRLVIATANPLWGPVLDIAERLRMKMPEGPHRFRHKDELVGILGDEGYDVIESGYSLLIPKRIPIIADALNELAEHNRYLKRLCLIQYIVARPSRRPKAQAPRKAHRPHRTPEAPIYRYP